MRTEAYSVGFDTRNYGAEIPEGFSEEELLKRREGNISDNIIRYLGEYRLGVKFDEFYYSFDHDEKNGTYLSSPHSDPGPIINTYRKAISYREQKGLSVDREVAECLGFQKLQQQLIDASAGTMAIWVSPPGAKEEGYGVHSFTFIGQVLEEEGEKLLRIIPYRNELSLEEHRDYLEIFDENAEAYERDTDFLANPSIVEQSVSIQAPEDIIRLIGEKEKFNIEWRERLTPLIMPLIGGFIDLVRKKASEGELLKARYAIENFVIDEKEYILGEEKKPQIIFESKPMEIFESYGSYVPPVVGGSCGMSVGGGNGLIGQEINVVGLVDKYGPRTFDCPSCKRTNLRPEGELVDFCQHCGSDEVSCCNGNGEKTQEKAAAAA